MIKTIPAVKLLRECFRYERSAGKLYWRKRPFRHFKSRKWGKHWNRRWAGKEAASITDTGHATVRIFGTAYKVHRVIWKIDKGVEPPSLLDHRDRKPSANIISNLRPASYSQNLINKNRQAGIKKARNGDWEARIHKDKKYIHLGTFGSRAAAIVARRQAEVRLYGEFAP